MMEKLKVWIVGAMLVCFSLNAAGCAPLLWFGAGAGAGAAADDDDD